MTTSGQTQNFQPLVQTRCVAYDRDKLTSKENAQTPYFDNTYIECFGDSNCEDMIEHADRTVDSAVWDTTDLEPKIKIFAPGETRKHPLRVAASIPFLRGGDVDSPVVGVSIVACTIMAHWAPSTFSISPSSRSLLTSNITDPSKFFEQDAPASILHMGSAIDIQDSWVPFLNPQLDTSSANTAFDSSVLLALINQTITHISDKNIPVLNNNYMDIPLENTVIILQPILGAVIADGLARAGSNALSLAVVASNATTDMVVNTGAYFGLELNAYLYD